MELKDIKLFIGEYYELKRNQEIIKSIDTDFFFGLVDGLIKSLEEKDKEIEKLKLINTSLENTRNCCPAMNTSKFKCESKQRISELEKMVELIVESIHYCIVPERECPNYKANCKDCIKQYFEQKAKEVE